jgi:hypothetical protein
MVYIGSRDHKVFAFHLCGYRWHLDPGNPPPQVQVRPDLIARGAQRLEEQQRLAEYSTQTQTIGHGSRIGTATVITPALHHSLLVLH